MESGLRGAAAQLENKQRHFGLRLLSLPQGDQAREVVGAPTALGRRLTNALAYAGRMESTVLPRAQETLSAELILEEEETAKAEAERTRPGLTMFTDGSRVESGASGYSVVWRRGEGWAGIKTHMGYKHCARQGQVSSSRFDGVLPTREWPATRKPTSGQRLRRKSQTPMGWNGRATAWTAGQKCGRFRSQGPLPTSSGRSRHPNPTVESRRPASTGPSRPRRSGQRRASGREAGPPRRNTECRKARSRTARLLGVPRGSPLGSTS